MLSDVSNNWFIFFLTEKKVPFKKFLNWVLRALSTGTYFALTFAILFILLLSGISSVLNLDLISCLPLYCFFPCLGGAHPVTYWEKDIWEAIFFFLDFAGLKISFLASMLSRLSHVWLFVIPWTVACQAPLSMGFSRQEYWSGLPWKSIIKNTKHTHKL